MTSRALRIAVLGAITFATAACACSREHAGEPLKPASNDLTIGQSSQRTSGEDPGCSETSCPAVAIAIEGDGFDITGRFLGKVGSPVNWVFTGVLNGGAKRKLGIWLMRMPPGALLEPVTGKPNFVHVVWTPQSLAEGRMIVVARDLDRCHALVAEEQAKQCDDPAKVIAGHEGKTQDISYRIEATPN